MYRIIWPAVAVFGLLACSDGTGPVTESPDAEASRLETLSREAGRGGDFERANALSSAVAALRAGGSLTRIVVSEGGVAREYVAAVLEIQPPATAVALPGIEELPPVRTLIAWAGARADRVLQISAFADSVEVGFLAMPEEATPGDPGVERFYPISFGVASFRRRATREALWATDGFAVIRRTSLDGPCAKALAGTRTCERATFTVRFKLDLAPLPLFAGPPFDQPVVALTMGAETQPVRGARIEPTCPPRGCFVPGAPLFPPVPGS
jgi:hypothetical protein